MLAVNANKKIDSFLSKRFEFKYIMDERTAREIEHYLKIVGLVQDGYSKEKPYLVNSLYFETPHFSDYYDKDGSILIRKKMRARTYEQNWYENPKRIWLEIKRKRNMNIDKSRVEITPDLWSKFISRDTSLVNLKHPGTREEEQVFNDFAYIYRRELYRPFVIIKYLRSAYLYPFTSPVRITFDRNVVVCRTNHEFGERMMTPVTQNQVVMEVKFNNKLPWWFRQIVEKYDLRRDDFSKYRNGVAILRGYNRIQISK